ncbi:unnamed protein product [Camellia sinensis]
MVKGRLEGGQLYTPAYVARVNAMVRGTARGITVPMNLSALWSSLQLLLHEMDRASGVAVESSFFQTLFNGLVKDGEILGSLRARVHWTPTVFAIAQKESDTPENSFISYDLLHKLGIPQSIQHLQLSNKAILLGESYVVSAGFVKLYEKALDLFEDDQSTSDMLNKLKTGIEVEESQNSEPASLSSGERLTLAKSLPGPLSVKAVAVVEASERKQVETFMTALRDIAEERQGSWFIYSICLLMRHFYQHGTKHTYWFVYICSELTLKKLDKKLERTLLHSYRKDLTSQVSAETDPVSLLAKVVSLLYIQVHNKALQAPGRAIFIAVSQLKGLHTQSVCKDKLDGSAYKILMDYHSATVTLLALMSAATGDTTDEDCTSNRILSKRELLEGLMPALKGLVVSTSQS